MGFLRNPRLTSPSLPFTVAWIPPTPFLPAAASGVTPSSPWTASQLPSPTVLPPTAPPVTVWTQWLATNMDSTDKVSVLIVFPLHREQEKRGGGCKKVWILYWKGFPSVHLERKRESNHQTRRLLHRASPTPFRSNSKIPIKIF